MDDSAHPGGRRGEAAGPAGNRVSLNLSVRGLDPSATLAINERTAALRQAGRSVYGLGLGQSPFPVPPRVVEALRFHASEKDYLPVKGLPALREAVAQFQRQKNTVDAEADNVLIGPGSKELMFLLQLCFYGDIVVPSPCWVSYVPQARILQRNVRVIPTRFEDDYRITPEGLRNLCERDRDDYRPRLLVLNYPSNPTGCSYTPAELKELAEVARQYQVLVLSDEIYGQLNFRGEHVSIARYYPEGTIVSSGLSKWCGAGGWRLGTFTFPSELKDLQEAMASVASETYTSVSAPIQYAAVRAFRGGMSIERYLWHARRILEAVADQCVATLRDVGARVPQPVGGFYLFPDFSPLADEFAKRGIHDSSTFCERLLAEAGVAILPGVDFQRPPEELTARLALVNFDGTRAMSASETIPLHEKLPDGFVETWCGPTLEAVDRLAKWVRGESP